MRVQEYVGGYAFDLDREHVLLVRKGHGPPLNVGKLNGIGGHIDDADRDGPWPSDEGPALRAMVREFREEAGLCTAPEDWRHIAFQWSADLYRIWWYAALIPLPILLEHQASTGDFNGEPVELFQVRDLWERKDLAELTRVHLALALDQTATLHEAPDLRVHYGDQGVAKSPVTQGG